MQRVHYGPLGPLVVVLLLWATACTASSNPPTSSAVTTALTTSIVTVTTAAPPPSSESVVESNPPAAPTVVVPRRPEGLDALNLDSLDLEVEGIAILNPSVVKVFPHDRTAVTESLSLISDTQLLESTGFYGRSSRRILDLAEGDLLQNVSLPPELYGSGISIAGSGEDAVGLQFTRLEQFVQRFSLTDLTLISEQRLEAEIRGACAISPTLTAISLADGTIEIISSDSLETVQIIAPLLGGSPLPTLTDLSCDGATIWALLGDTSGIAQISIETGAVVSLADLSGLTPAGLAETDVLSGLTYRPSTETWFVTGKRWDVLYEISLGS